MLSRTLLAAAAFTALASGAMAQSIPAYPAPWEKDLSHPQDAPLPLPYVSPAEQAHNKQVVLDFYHKVADAQDWSEANMLKYFAPDFRQHDEAEPSTVKAYGQYMSGMRAFFAKSAPDGKAPPAGPMVMPGHNPHDANNSPVNALFADGDFVLVVRQRNWDWPTGPEPVYNGVFVDIWRLKNGKITDQWCSCTPADAQLAHMQQAREAGQWVK